MPEEALGHGQYRAFVTFEGVGIGLLGGLHVTGTDSDFTEIGGVAPGTATGNVITDPGPGGEVDIVDVGTHVQSVTVNGATTAVIADGTVVAGQYGTLTINLDGSYSYTPSASTTVIGQTEVFQYTIIDPSDGELETATLTISIGSDDITGAPLAVDDAGIATVTFENVVTTIPPTQEFSFNTPIAVVLPVTRSGSDSFTVEPNATGDVTITAIRTGLLSVLPTYTITVQDDGGAVVGTITQTAIAGLPLGSGVVFTLEDLPAGTYTYTVSSTNILGTGYDTTVYVGQSVTHLDQFEVQDTTAAEGNLLDNDNTGTAFAVVRVESGGSFVEVGDAPLVVTGLHGTLTVDETGNYVYEPNPALPYSATDLTDSFTYQIVQPNGQIATATLEVTIDVPADGPAALAFSTFMQDEGFGQDVVALDGIEMTSNNLEVSANGLDSLAYEMFEGQGELEDVLNRYLDTPAETDNGTSVQVLEIDTNTMPSSEPSDPLEYLAIDDEINKIGQNLSDFS